MSHFKQKFKLLPHHTERIQALCGVCHENIAHLEQIFHVRIKQRENAFCIEGTELSVSQASKIIHAIYQQTSHATHIDKTDITRIANQQQTPQQKTSIKLADRHIYLQNQKQIDYLSNIHLNTITFAYGPAGTGKTFLAVTAAIEALYKQEIKKLILVRPAVNAGESIGFLPGDINEKFNPYLQPFYDSLSSLLPAEKKKRYLQDNTIEIAPLAFMRGRTLKNAFIILDEGQNTSIEQMKMILTRIGYNSKLCITGDPSQVDLPKSQPSGLTHARKVLQGIPDISHIVFDSQHVVRHHLIQKILNAYEKESS